MSDCVRVNVFNVDAALAVGRAKGFFASQDLDVEVIVTPNSTDQMRGLSKGEWQIVSTAFDNVLGWSGREGPEMIAIARVGQGVLLPMYVRPEIRSWNDLRGRKFAVDAVDTAFALVLRRIVFAHDLVMERGDYELVPLGSTGFRLESMTRGETFAGILNPPWDKKAEAAGMRRFADHREVLPDYPGGVFAVRRDWAANNESLLVKYLRIWDEALRWSHHENNRGDAIKALSEAEKIDETAAANRLRQSPPSGRLNLPGLQCVLDLRVQFNLTPRMGQELKAYYDESFYRAASS